MLLNDVPSETGAKSIAVSLSLLTNSFLAPEASNFKQHSFLLNIAANIKRESMSIAIIRIDLSASHNSF